MKEKCLILFIFILCFVFATSIEAKTGHKKKSKKVVSITHNVETPIAALNNVKEYEIITKTFPLNYIEPQVMADKLKIAFSSITVLCDDDTNSLSVSVSSNSLKDIANFIAKSDIKEETIGIKIIFLELNENYTQNIITSDSAGTFLTKSELSDIYNLDLKGKAKKIYESGNFISTYNSTTTIIFNTNYSRDYSGKLEVSLCPVGISTQSAQLSATITLNAYSQDLSTNTKAITVFQFQKNVQNSVLINNAINNETRELVFSHPFMSSLNEVGQMFDKESILCSESKIVLIIQLQGMDNE